MTQEAQKFVQQMSVTKERNLAFFERYFKNIYDTFKNRELRTSKLNIDPNKLTVDLLVDDLPSYNGDAINHSRKEALEFSNAFKVNSMNHPLRHTYVGELHSGRYFHGNLEAFLKDVKAFKGSARPYIFEHSIPQVVFLGSGLGIHISELLKLRKIRHAILVEHNPDNFLASLYITDWQTIIQPFIDDQSCSFTLSIGDTIQEPEDIRVHTAFSAAWNAACQNIPFLPVQTVLYIHQADPFYTKVASRFNKEIEPFVNVWGYYDDEVNQLNHVLHNFKSKKPILSKIDLSNDSRVTLICGNGPSLDPYLPIIKENRKLINVISAGSTTHTLLKNDIIPDFMVTLESDLATYEALTLLPKNKAKLTPIVAAAQVHPKTFDIFGGAVIYMKQETAFSHVFSNTDEQIANGTPSATNAAIAVALDLKLPNIFLVGMDFGFLDPTQSHASDSFYSKTGDEAFEETFKKFKERIAKDSYLLEENQFGKIFTTPFYNTGRIHCQRKIMESKRTDIHNLSTGATIERTEFSGQEALIEAISRLEIENDLEPIFDRIMESSRIIKHNQIVKGVNRIKQYISKTSQEIIELLEKIEPHRESIDDHVFKIVQLISGKKSRQNGSLNMMLRGTIWHWCFNYYALTKQVDRQDQIEEITDSWKAHFTYFLRNLPEHFSNYIDIKDSESDFLNLTISDAEPNIDDWLYKGTKVTHSE